jgi:predicted PhzF superfamily epimerase YddE/YHI9
VREPNAGLDLPAVIVTAPAAGEVDFVSRFFAPANGVPEDPVSGVAQLCLAPYWANGWASANSPGASSPGAAASSHCEDLGACVELAGNAVTVLEGRFRL